MAGSFLTSIIVAIAMQSSGQLQDFAYEIGRAKGTLSVYGEHAYRNERIHVRVGQNGSRVETYCAVTQSRNEDGRVDEKPFYWVVRVQPQEGYLSDYERGAWQNPPAGALADFNKLCVETASISDSELLRSKEHTSSGSVYDPAAESRAGVSAEWLVGSWVSTDTCATSRDELFRADGSYEGSEGSGRWAIDGNALRLHVLQKELLDAEGEPIGYTPLPAPKFITIPIDRIAIDRMRTHGKYHLLRC